MKWYNILNKNGDEKMKIILKYLLYSFYCLIFFVLGFFAFEYADRFLPFYVIGFIFLWYSEIIISFLKKKFKKNKK